MQTKALKYKDISGQKFNRLTAIEYVYSNNKGHAMWKCLCNCGKELIVLGLHLRNGNTNSCGCYQKDRARQESIGQTHSRKPKGESGFTRLIRDYKRSAKERNLEFDNSKDFEELFRKLTKEDCTYCDIKPYKISRSHDGSSTLEGIEHSKYIYNGLDRIDNSKGYTKDNILPCCWVCNSVRNEFFSVDEMKIIGQTIKTIREAREQKLNEFKGEL